MANWVERSRWADFEEALEIEQIFPAIPDTFRELAVKVYSLSTNSWCVSGIECRYFITRRTPRRSSANLYLSFETYDASPILLGLSGYQSGQSTFLFVWNPIKEDVEGVKVIFMQGSKKQQTNCRKQITPIFWRSLKNRRNQF